jgi:3-isopropylmalate dehydrogenase
MGKTFNIGVIPGDGIGPEVITQALRVLDVCQELSDVSFDLHMFDLGAERYLRTGDILPAESLDQLKTVDAILLGAVGDPRVKPGILERELLLRLRFELNLYVNLRPIQLFEGVQSPLAGKSSAEIDFVVCREGTEGLYAGRGRSEQVETRNELALEESVNTYQAIERLLRFAFELSMTRDKHLTLIHKTNVLTFAGSLWMRVFEELAREFPDVSTHYMHVDAASMFFVTRPEEFDVIATDNLFGDILTDLGAAISGGIGLAASGNINPTRLTPSMFEPIHGSAPDIKGTQRANPIAAILSVKMMFEHLGLHDLSELITRSVAKDIKQNFAAARSTSQIADGIIHHMRGSSHEN